MRYIKQIPSGSYMIQKNINGTCISYGSFKTLAEAKKHRDLCIQNNWDEKLKIRGNNMLESKYKKYLSDNDLKLLKLFQTERGLNQRTMYGYYTALGLYVHYCNMHLQELLDEADQEEEDGVRWKKSKLKQKLLGFRSYLIEEYTHGTVKVHFGRIKTFYNHFEIDMGYIPKINIKSVRKNEPIRFDDLLSKEELQGIVDEADPLIEAIVLFGVSSGCARAEMLSITLDDFIESTKDYHNGGSIQEILVTLLARNDVVPTFKIRRVKTNKYYYTFCSPEAVRSICNYLIISQRKFKGHNEDKLFKINRDYLNTGFKEINDKLGLGEVNGYKRLRSHMLRKFNASHLYDDGMSMEDVDAIQGRAKDETHNAYFKDNPIKLKEKYIEHLDAVTVKT